MSEKIRGGAVVWARQTIESDIFFYKPADWFKIWFYIISRVNHKKNKLFDRGEGLIPYGEIQERCKVSRTQIEKCLKWMKREQMIDERKTTRGNIKIVRNYNLFQTMENYINLRETNRNPRRDEPQTNRRRTLDDQKAVSINKNDKNDKNDNKIKEEADFFNSLSREDQWLVRKGYAKIQNNELFPTVF